MATLDRDLFDYLASETGFTEGTDIFRGPYPPEQPDNAVAVILRLGGTEAADRWATPRLQVLIRSRSQDWALGALSKVRSALAANYAVTLGSQTLHGSFERSSGFVGFDSRQRREYSANYDLVTQFLVGPPGVNS